MLLSARNDTYVAKKTPENFERLVGYTEAIEHLVSVVQDLSLAHDLESIINIVKNAARRLTGADGATFVLKEGANCHYADENAISPLWKGKRFPMESCISGWAMLNGKAAVIKDIYADHRIPAAAYRPTFVKSLVMVPIRKNAPIGAIGNYWADHHEATEEEVAILQALADTTSVAMENAALYTELQAKVKALMESNYDLSRFAWVASLDLKDSLRKIADCTALLSRDYHQVLDEPAQGYLQTTMFHSKKLLDEIEELLVHARIEKMQDFKPVAVEQLISEAMTYMHSDIAAAGATITYSDKLPWVWGDPVLLRRLFQNLLSNAVKFRKAGGRPIIHVDAINHNDAWQFVVSDNGIGIEPANHEKIFMLFHRLHSQERYPGSGIGLATCKKIVEHHDGKIWVKSVPGNGSKFYFTLCLKVDYDKPSR